MRAQHWAIFTVISEAANIVSVRALAFAVVGALLMSAFAPSVWRSLCLARPPRTRARACHPSTIAPRSHRLRAGGLLRPAHGAEENERVAPESKPAPNPMPQSGQSEPSR